MTLKQIFYMKFQYFKLTTPAHNLSKANQKMYLRVFLNPFYDSLSAFH